MSNKPRGHVAQQMHRGFSSLKAGKIFQQFAELAAKEMRLTTVPTHVMDVYDMLPQMVASRTNGAFDKVVKPEFLQSVMDDLSQAMKREVRFCLHTPPRHGKTLMIHASLLFYHFTCPGVINMYLTYDQSKADHERIQFTDLLETMNIEFKVWNDRVHIEGGSNKGGTTVIFRGVTRPTAGFDVSGIIFIDDAVKSDEKALSPKQRDKLWSVIMDVTTRKLGHSVFNADPTKPVRGLSIVVVMTRWNKDDITGRCIAQFKWPYVCLPALGRRQDGQLHPLWDSRYDVAYYLGLKETQSEKTWAAKFQGEPFTDGDQVFNKTITLYDELPMVPLQWSIGLDAGYTPLKGDWSVACVLARDPQIDQIYIVKVVRRMAVFQQFINDVKLLVSEFPGASITWLYGGQEKELAQLLSSPMMKNPLPGINTIPSQGKTTNASYFQDHWNNGKVSAPRLQSPQIKTFITNIADFTGFDDSHDDDMDAMSSAMHGFFKTAVMINYPKQFARPRVMGNQDLGSFGARGQISGLPRRRGFVK